MALRSRTPTSYIMYIACPSNANSLTPRDKTPGNDNSHGRNPVLFTDDDHDDDDRTLLVSISWSAARKRKTDSDKNTYRWDKTEDELSVVRTAAQVNPGNDTINELWNTIRYSLQPNKTRNIPNVMLLIYVYQKRGKKTKEQRNDGWKTKKKEREKEIFQKEGWKIVTTKNEPKMYLGHGPSPEDYSSR